MTQNLFYRIKPVNLFMGFIGLIFCWSQLKAQTLDSIVKLHQKAVGGDRIVNIKSIYIEGVSISSQGKISSVLKIYKHVPDYYRHELISYNRIIFSCYNGVSHCIGREPYAAWLNQLSKLREEHSKEITKPYFIDGILNRQKEDSISISSHTDDKNYVLVVNKSHEETFYYIDKNNYYISRVEIINLLNSYTNS